MPYLLVIQAEDVEVPLIIHQLSEAEEACAFYKGTQKSLRQVSMAEVLRLTLKALRDEPNWWNS